MTASTIQVNLQLIIRVWIKAHPLPGQDATIWRRDDYGTIIRYADYGRRDSQYGWELDHVRPISRGGTDHLDNLRPLHWRNNASRGDGLR